MLSAHSLQVAGFCDQERCDFCCGNEAEPDPVSELAACAAMCDEHSTMELLRRLREADEQAAEELYRRYLPRLINVARQHIGGRLRRRVDPEEAAHSGLRTFFRRYSEGQFQIRDSSDLARLLTKIVLNKSRLKGLEHTAHKRSIKAETDLDDSQLEQLAPSEGLGPAEVAVGADLLEHLVAGATDRDAEILLLSLQGYTIAEIATRLGPARCTIRRVLERFANRLRGVDEEEAIE